MPGLTEAAGEPRCFCRLSQDAKRTGDRRSGQHPPGGSPGPREQSLDAKDAALIRAVFQSYLYVTDLVEDKNTSIRRLRQLFFGKRTEKTKAVVGSGKPEATPEEATSRSEAAADTRRLPASRLKTGPTRQTPAPPPPVTAATVRTLTAVPSGSRFPTHRWPPATRVPVCGDGIVYEKAPGVLVRITGPAPLTATI